jgi:hypothetical protein
MAKSDSNVPLLGNTDKNIKHVMIGIQFDRIGEIDTMNEKYYAELTIEAKWKVNKIISVFNPETEWNPKLYIENAINEPKEIVKYFFQKEDDSTLITQFRNVKGW